MAFFCPFDGSQALIVQCLNQISCHVHTSLPSAKSIWVQWCWIPRVTASLRALLGWAALVVPSPYYSTWQASEQFSCPRFFLCANIAEGKGRVAGDFYSGFCMTWQLRSWTGLLLVLVVFFWVVGYTLPRTTVSSVVSVSFAAVGDVRQWQQVI